MTRILVFSPYAIWTIHTVYEETMAKACRAQGAEVEYLLCDGLLPECDQHWDSKEKGHRPADLCQRCQAKAKTGAAALDFPHRWLGEFLNETEKTAAFGWAQRVAPAELARAAYLGNPLGEWVLSSVISYFRQYPPDTENQHVVNVYRGFLYSAALTAIGLGNYLAQSAIDSALLFNGRQSVTRVALEIFHAHGIRVLTHERAEYERGHINLKPDAHCMSLEPFKAFWSMWAKVPLTRKSLDTALRWLVQRRYGANLAWIPFNTSSMQDSALRKKMNLSPNKRLWVLFTSSNDEIAGDPQWQGPYDSQADWVRDVVQWVKDRAEVELIIKVHPNLGGNSYIGQAAGELRIYQEMQAELPANVRMVMPGDTVNTYALTDEADVGMTFGSTIGLEMAMLGKPVLMASRALYEGGARFLTLRAREALPEMLERCLHASPDREIQREAFRLAYNYIFAFEPPFPAVIMQGIYEARVNYQGREALAPGKDDSLDHICNFLIKGHPLFDPPTAEERARTTVEEDAFFDGLERSPDYLRNVRYERWLWLQSFGRSATKLLRHLPFGVGQALLDLGRRRWKALLSWMEQNA